jgi:hypothetical protein
MIFADLSALQKQTAAVVPDHHRKCPVQVATPMRLELLGNAEFTILMIDEHDIFLQH